jgi:hypothetical protein
MKLHSFKRPECALVLTIVNAQEGGLSTKCGVYCHEAFIACKILYISSPVAVGGQYIRNTCRLHVAVASVVSGNEVERNKHIFRIFFSQKTIIC